MADEEDCPDVVCKDDPFADLRAHLKGGNQQCPLNRQELGLYSWSILHTFAAYYPSQPTPEDQQSIKGLLKGFRDLYPCSHCRPHFQKDYDKGTNISRKILRKLKAEIRYQCGYADSTTE